MEDKFVKLGPEDVEQAFQELINEKLDNTQFLETLMQSKLFTMMDQPPEGALASEKGNARMLRFQDAKSGDEMVALYTEQEDARKAREQAPDFEHLGRVDVLWALLHMEANQGLMVNSKEGRAFRIAPEGVAQLRSSVQQAFGE